ncbi:hypothetical protein QFZ60_002197 [Arthrobacter sp. B2I5]|uniref:hypothetical protein n=1 Tax=Arthrobacter sp. B2I5 TaxID=3042266 RepID=UPI0027813499|nr:hypothetical protein [Arthrobacter sp. B2I5]MDQ0826024.1 hypothetical protein [Arthrobacter sp. B2I5]
MGYRVHAFDGDIGKVDEASYAVDESSIVVDTGPWIFGRKVILPAGTIQRVDDADEKVYVDLTKAQIKDSPELDDATADDPAYRDRLGTYYGEFYRSPRGCRRLPGTRRRCPLRHPSTHPPIHPPIHGISTLKLRGVRTGRPRIGLPCRSRLRSVKEPSTGRLPTIS